MTALIMDIANSAGFLSIPGFLVLFMAILSGYTRGADVRAAWDCNRRYHHTTTPGIREM